MTRIPKAPLLLGLAGLIPFLWGAVVATGLISVTMGTIESGGYVLIVATDGPVLLARYGIVILCFMSGVLWGFATKTEGRLAGACYALSVLPALWAFQTLGRPAEEALINLIVGFAGLLLLDYNFSRWGLTPAWWMPLRILLTAIVLLCLAAGVWA